MAVSRFAFAARRQASSCTLTACGKDARVHTKFRSKLHREGKVWHQRSEYQPLKMADNAPSHTLSSDTVKSKSERLAGSGVVRAFVLSGFRDSEWMALFAVTHCSLRCCSLLRQMSIARCPDCPKCPDSPGRMPAGRYCNLFFHDLPIPARLLFPLSPDTLSMPLWVTATRLPQSPPLWTLRCDPKFTNCTHHTQPEAPLCSIP